MNWFMLIIAVLYLGAAAVEFWYRRWLMGTVYLSWAVSNAALFWRR